MREHGAISLGQHRLEVGSASDAAAAATQLVAALGAVCQPGLHALFDGGRVVGGAEQRRPRVRDDGHPRVCEVGGEGWTSASAASTAARIPLATASSTVVHHVFRHRARLGHA